jgi:hypothetical protein
MSKTQEKRTNRLNEQQEFIKARRIMQLNIFKQNFEAGLTVYENSKDKLSTEDITLIEAEIERNKALIEQLQAEVNGFNTGN